MVEERAKRERNRQLLADADVISLIAADPIALAAQRAEGDLYLTFEMSNHEVQQRYLPLSLQQTPEDAERARKDEKNRKVREQRAAKKAADK